MPKIGDVERKTQDRLIKLFCEKLHYTYLGDLHDSVNSNIMQDRLKGWLLRQGYSTKITEKAITGLYKAATNLQQGLYHANKEVYSLLKYGAKVRESADQAPQTVFFIDYENAAANDFQIAV